VFRNRVWLIQQVIRILRHPTRRHGLWTTHQSRRPSSSRFEAGYQLLLRQCRSLGILASRSPGFQRPIGYRCRPIQRSSYVDSASGRIDPTRYSDHREGVLDGWSACLLSNDSSQPIRQSSIQSHLKIVLIHLSNRTPSRSHRSPMQTILTIHCLSSSGLETVSLVRLLKEPPKAHHQKYRSSSRVLTVHWKRS
jgi:hypothetical protein